MSVGLVLGITGGGAVGAAARFYADGALSARSRTDFAILAILAVNVAGSLVLGVLTGLVLFDGVSDSWRVVLGTGFCGGFTTFSTTAYAGVRLAQRHRPVLAALNVLGTLLLCTVAAAVGLALSAL